MEIVIKGDEIYPVQARPVNRLPMLPTYLNRRKLSLAEAVPLLDSVQAETLVPGRASAFILKDADAVLIAPTLQEAEAAFNDKRHHLVIVQHSEPANSHPVVNFSNLGVPCLFASTGPLPNLFSSRFLQIHPSWCVCRQAPFIYGIHKKQSRTTTSHQALLCTLLKSLSLCLRQP